MPSSPPSDWTEWVSGSLREHERARSPSGAPSNESGDSAPSLSRYELGEVLGEGATAIVYRARDRQLQRDVAVKVLRMPVAWTPTARDRFQREARTAAGLAHPNVVAVHDTGEKDGLPFLVLELVEGRPLNALLAEARQDVPSLVGILERAARGVAAAHDKGIVHRDLKPANILVDRSGEPKVSDFGLAHVDDSTVELTRTGTILGTPLYMAPEQVDGRAKEITPRTDVHALGAILYEILCGRPPYTGDSTAELYGKITRGDPRPPRKLNPKAPRELEIIALKALEKDPARRYAHAGEFADDLARYQAGQPIRAHAPGVFYVLRRRLTQHRAKVAVLACVAVTAAAVLASLRSDPLQQVVLERVEGEVVTVTPAGRVPALPGKTIVSGQGLDTLGPKSRAVLRYDDGTSIDLDGGSRLRLPPGLGGKTLYLEEGKLTAAVTGGDDPPLVVSTPQGEVRTAQGRITVTATSAWTRLECKEGVARLRRLKDGADADVKSGQYAVAEAGTRLVSRSTPPAGKVPREGLQLWLRADEGVTLQDGRVSHWADRSGKERHATQKTVRLRPRLEKDAVGGNPILSFDEPEFLDLPPGFENLTGGVSLFAVGRPLLESGRLLMMVQQKGPAMSEGFIFGAGPDQVVYTLFLDGKRGGLTGLKRFDTPCQSFAVIHAPSSAAVYRNGGLLASGPVPLPARAVHSRTSVGDNVQTYQGELAEIILYDRALSDAERRDVEAYLHRKYLDPALEPADAGRGLLGEYYEGHEFRARSATRLDPKVYFNWTKSAAIPALGRTASYSVRWTGVLTPETSASYTFHARSDHGARLWVGDSLVLEGAGGDHDSQPVRLEAGRRYPLKLETRHAKATARAKLSWSSPSLPEEVVPRRCLLAPAK